MLWNYAIKFMFWKSETFKLGEGPVTNILEFLISFLGRASNVLVHLGFCYHLKKKKIAELIIAVVTGCLGYIGTLLLT